MRKIAFILFLVLLVFQPSASWAVSSTDLVEKSKFYDGKTVDFTGEVIGDVMIRGKQAWINVNDDAYAFEKPGQAKLHGYNSGQAIFIPKKLARKIKIAGDYTYRGDIVKVSGLFHQACPQHGGEMMIHGTRLELVGSGYRFGHELQTVKIGWIAALGLVFLLVTAFKTLRNRSNN